jgi:2-keto-4-pentenoate hydratase
MVKNIVYPLLLSLAFLGCDKENFQWNREKVFRLPTVNTLGFNNIYNTGASISGEIVRDGGSAVTQRGVCWSTSQNPTIADNITNNGTGIGSFSSSLTDLNVGTTYYIRAYAINEVGTAYGNQISLTTTNISAALPILTTASATGISTNSGISGGTVTSDGGSAVTQRGVCWSTNQNPTISDNITNEGTGIGPFTSSLTNLNASTTYFIKAYAINGVGTAYGNQISFTTANISMTLPTLTTVSASAISVNSSVSGGTITSDGGSAVTQRGVCWSTNQNPTIADNITNNGSGIGSFSSSLTNLSANTAYYTKAYAINGVGTAYGNQISFTTPSPVAVSVGNNTCASLNGITSLYYGMNGTSAPWGLSGVGYSGTCWVAPDPNNSGQLGTVVGANHYVQFNRNFLNQGYIEFWVNTSNPGYNNLIPVIAVNGSGIGNATMIGGQQSSFYWMKVRSPIMPAGNNTIKILLSGSYYVLKIDEIEFFEY